ncbi:MAG TPA: hypothetical protein VKB93_24685 [Thermoanaerobaculia bacterium]|nr:hypothetical protein [Thermoanaerobaculia bacterium]
MRVWLARVRLSLVLLTERRLALFAVIDGFFLFAGFSIALLGSGSATDFWLPMFLLPALFVAVPILADAVAVERRSGTLDLALTSPGADRYFERRAIAVAALLVAQGWLGVLLARLIGEPFPLSGPFAQVIVTAIFLAAAVLYWAVRLETTGAAMFATYATAAVFAKWLFSNPIHPPTTLQPMELGDYIDYAQQNLVLSLAAAVFYLYTRQRLARPERLL